MNDFYIPEKTRERLRGPHPVGTRHQEMVEIAYSMAGDYTHDQIYSTLRQAFPYEDKSDREIHKIVQSGIDKHPAPYGNGSRAQPSGRHEAPVEWTEPQTPAKAKAPEEAARELIGRTLIVGSEWLKRSPIAIPEDPTEATIKFFECIYRKGEHINILAKFTMDGGRCCPSGGGKTMAREDWIAYFRAHGIPKSEAGCWMRHSPCRPGAGNGKGVADADIADFRFLLVESDSLTLEEQFTLYSKLKIPIAALVGSGGDSIHAWLRVDASSRENFDAKAKSLYSFLKGLGFDSACKNPSRLCRLPGAVRTHGAVNGGLQRLYYLNPQPAPLNFEKFKASCEPLPNLLSAKDMGPVVAEYMAPRPDPFTLPIFKIHNPYAQAYEREGFYMNPAEVTIWSGHTGHGKSSLLANVMLEAIIQEKRVWIASFEHLSAQMLIFLCRIGCGKHPNDEAMQFFVGDIGDRIQFCDIVGEASPEEIYSQMRAVHERFGVEHFFIDSLMRVSGLDENYPAQGAFMNGLQKIAKETGGHVHLVAHPRKGDETVRGKKSDVRGSGTLTANADNVVFLQRNMAKQKMREEKKSLEELAKVHDAEFTVEKQRASGWMGAIKLNYDLRSRAFSIFTPPPEDPFK